MDLCIEKVTVAYDRAVRARGGDADLKCPKFLAEFADQIRKVAIEEYLNSCATVERVGVADDGEIIWAIASQSKLALSAAVV